jgi:hypothetical protein
MLRNAVHDALEFAGPLKKRIIPGIHRDVVFPVSRFFMRVYRALDVGTIRAGMEDGFIEPDHGCEWLQFHPNERQPRPQV